MIRAPFLLGALGAALLAGCGDDESTELTISAASSLTGAFEEYGDETEAEERFSFAGSDDLAAQIRSGAPADIFASANTSLPGDLFKEGLVDEPETFIANQLVLAVPEDSGIDDVADLQRGGFDLVVGSENVPVGSYTRQVLDGLPEAEADAILEQVRSEEPDVKSIVGKLVAGAADAGFVYASDVEATNGDLVAIELPPELEPVVAYGIAIVSDSGDKEAAQEFIDGVVDGEGHDILLDSGFLEAEAG